MPDDSWDQERRRMNAFLRGETSSYVGGHGTTYRRVRRDGREFFEQSYQDGRTKSDEITPDLQALFDRIASTDDAAELERIYRDAGIPLPGDPVARRLN